MEYNPDTPEGIELLGKQRPNSMALVDEFMKDFEGLFTFCDVEGEIKGIIEPSCRF